MADSTSLAGSPGLLRGLALAAALVVAGGCAPQPKPALPTALPNTTNEQFLTLRWALVREGGTVRAAGMAEPSGGREWDATLALEGVDAHGRVLTRSTSAVRSGFTGGPEEFQVNLVPKGGETEFRLRVVDARQFQRAGGR
jgi:hypothetical protein